MIRGSAAVRPRAETNSAHPLAVVSYLAGRAGCVIMCFVARCFCQHGVNQQQTDLLDANNNKAVEMVA